MADFPLLLSPLVSTQWLADHLGADALAVVDATVLYPSAAEPAGPASGRDAYLNHGHLPGAVFADLVAEFSDPSSRLPFTRPDRERFETAASRLGIDNETVVIVYDRALGQWAARLWWLFRAFGHDRVAVLDGGQRKWLAEQRPTDTEHVRPVTASFTALQREELWADKARVKGVLAGSEQATLVCALPATEFSGAEGSFTRPGHIPGSRNIPISHVVDVRGDNSVHPLPRLREHFAEVLGTGTIITYCGGGVAATVDALALTLLGETNVAVYDGSLSEWAADPKLPLVTTA